MKIKRLLKTLLLISAPIFVPVKRGIVWCEVSNGNDQEMCHRQQCLGNHTGNVYEEEERPHIIWGHSLEKKVIALGQLGRRPPPNVSLIDSHPQRTLIS